MSQNATRGGIHLRWNVGRNVRGWLVYDAVLTQICIGTRPHPSCFAGVHTTSSGF